MRGARSDVYRLVWVHVASELEPGDKATTLEVIDAVAQLQPDVDAGAVWGALGLATGAGFLDRTPTKPGRAVTWRRLGTPFDKGSPLTFEWVLAQGVLSPQQVLNFLRALESAKLIAFKKDGYVRLD